MSKRNKPVPSCATCTVDLQKRICVNSNGIGHKGCPTITKKDVVEEALHCYQNDEKLLEFARKSAIQEGEGYVTSQDKPGHPIPAKPRVLEIINFAHKMGYKKLGLAFCEGLRREAAVLHEILENHGFDVVSCICKTGGLPKETLGLADSQKILPGEEENMCNPVLQAKVLEKEETEFNLLLGLCVGHDSMFFQFSHVPVTVVGVKDRVTCHNPVAVLYNSDSYYEYFKKP